MDGCRKTLDLSGISDEFQKQVQVVFQGVRVIPHKQNKKVRFVTGSAYEGPFDGLGMADWGTYIFPNGVIYKGQFKDSTFNGEGTLIYPNGGKIEGVWNNGQLAAYRYRFPDELEYYEPWDYCKFPDRRFQRSKHDGLNPPGKENETMKYPPRRIPSQCYDVEDGFYDPTFHCVFNLREDKMRQSVSSSTDTSYSGLSQESSRSGGTTGRKAKALVKDITGIPKVESEEWIKKYCRKAWDEPVGYQPNLLPDSSISISRPSIFPSEFYLDENIFNLKDSYPSVTTLDQKPEVFRILDYEVNYNPTALQKPGGTPTSSPAEDKPGSVAGDNVRASSGGIISKLLDEEDDLSHLTTVSGHLKPVSIHHLGLRRKSTMRYGQYGLGLMRGHRESVMEGGSQRKGGAGAMTGAQNQEKEKGKWTRPNFDRQIEIVSYTHRGS